MKDTPAAAVRLARLLRDPGGSIGLLRRERNGSGEGARYEDPAKTTAKDRGPEVELVDDLNRRETADFRFGKPGCFRHQLLAPRSSTVPAVESATRFLITSSTRTIAGSEDATLPQRHLHEQLIEGALLADRTIVHPLAAWQHWMAEAPSYPLSICSAVPREVCATRGEESRRPNAPSPH